jgi:integrase
MQSSVSQRSARGRLPKRVTGIEPRHARSCPAKGWDAESVCNCAPTFQASVFIAREGKLVRKTFSSIAAAKSWRADSMQSVKRGTLNAPTRQTVNAAADALIEGMRDGTIRNRNRKPYKPSVIRTYEVWLDARIREAFGSRKLTELHRNDLQEYIEELVAEGLDGSTIRNVLMPLRVIFRRAIQRGEVAVNPLDYLELPAVEGTRDRVADPKEAESLLAALDGDDRPLWATALFSGLRLGELLALRVEDVDLNAGVIRVERSWDRVEGVIEPKSKAGARVVPICSRLRVYLEARIDSLAWESGLVFGETAMRPFDYFKTTARAYKAWKDAKLERITLHECRHSFRSYLDYAGISEARCDRYLGHASHTVGRRYTHAFESQLVADASALDEYLDGAADGKIVPLVAVGMAS